MAIDNISGTAASSPLPLAQTAQTSAQHQGGQVHQGHGRHHRSQQAQTSGTATAAAPPPGRGAGFAAGRIAQGHRRLIAAGRRV